MIAPFFFASILSLAATSTDSASASGATSIETTPVAPKSKEWKADSAWNREAWSIEAGYREGLAWGDPLDAENDMADAVDLTVKSYGKSTRPVILLEDYSLGMGIWRNLGARLDLGAGYEHSWTLLVAGQNGLDLLLSSDALPARARYWIFRRLQWEIGAKVGCGPMWGTLTRYPLEQNATLSGTPYEVFLASSRLATANDDLAVFGIWTEFGATMEVRILPKFSIGGSLQAVRKGMSLSGSDPVKGLLFKDYPTDPVQWEVGLELHAAYRL
jgi:hypothetical protein